MRNAQRITGVTAGCVLLLAAGLVSGEDWPQWRGPNRDGRVTGFTVPAAWPKQLTKKWSVPVGNGDSTPALVGDKLYVFGRVGGDEVTTCLNVADGTTVWQDKYPAKAADGPASGHPGPRSSPTVVDGKVCTLGVSGMVSCLDAAKGTVLWRKDSAKEGFPDVPQFYTSVSPLVVDGMCIVHLGGKGKGAMIAYDLGSGAQKWNWPGDAPAYSSPALLTADGTKMIVSMTETKVVGVGAADGKLLWETPFPPGRMGAYNAPSPIIDGTTVIVTAQGHGMRALKIAKDGETFKATQLWNNPDIATQFNTPVLTKGGLLFGLSAGAGGRGGGGGKFFCVNAKDGKTAWLDATARGTTYCEMVDAGSAIVAQMENGDLVVIDPSDKAYTEVARYKGSEKKTYAYPILAGKNIVVRDQESLTLWTVE